MKTLFLQSNSSIQCRILLVILLKTPDNEEELSDSHSFDELIHAMNENIFGNVGDITSEVDGLESCKTKKYVSLFVQYIKMN